MFAEPFCSRCLDVVQVFKNDKWNESKDMMSMLRLSDRTQSRKALSSVDFFVTELLNWVNELKQYNWQCSAFRILFVLAVWNTDYNLILVHEETGQKCIGSICECEWGCFPMLALAQFYFWSSTLWPVHTWLTPSAQVAWRSLEENLVKPHRLQDLIYSNIPIKTCKSKFGSLISHLVATWRTVVSHSSTHLKFHPHLPLFNNFSLCLGGQLISFPQWSDKVINTLSDITSENTLRSFQDLKSHFNLPGTSFFFYLQLRSALRA